MITSIVKRLASEAPGRAVTLCRVPFHVETSAIFTLSGSQWTREIKRRYVLLGFCFRAAQIVSLTRGGFGELRIGLQSGKWKEKNTTE